MGNFKRKLLAVLLLLVIGVTPVFANMPVIDITAIVQAVQGYVQTIKEWNATVQQWKSEYDRIAKAAKGIATGDFSEVIKSVGSLANQVSGWELGKKLTDGKSLYFDNALSSIGDGSYSILALLSDSDILMANWDTLSETIENNAQKILDDMQSAYDKAEDGWDQAGAIGSGTADLYLSIANTLENLLVQGGDVAKDIQDIFNNFTSFLNVSPEEYAQVMEKMVKKSIEKATNNKAHNSGDILEMKTKQDNLINEFDEKLKKYTSEDATQREQVQAQKAAAERLSATYNDLYTWAVNMDAEIAKIRGQQADYVERLANEEQKLLIWTTSIEEEKAKRELKDNLAETEKKRKAMKKAEKDAAMNIQRQLDGNL